jgi:DNA-binding IclR family transcriptional regulator
MAQKNAENPIQTTKSSFLILRSLADRGGATLAELDGDIDLSKGAIYNHLATLEEVGVIVKRGDTYYPSLRTFQYSEAARKTLPGAEAARKKLWDLADTTGEFAALVVWEDDVGVVMDIAAGQLTDTIWLTAGEELPLHSTAAGKVILSQMPEGRIRELCSESDDDVDCDALVEEIGTVRAQGIAFSRGEYHDNRYSVAAPVVNREKDLVYVVTLIGPKVRLSGKSLQQDIAGLVVSTANEIQLSENHILR